MTGPEAFAALLAGFVGGAFSWWRYGKTVYLGERLAILNVLHRSPPKTVEEVGEALYERYGIYPEFSSGIKLRRRWGLSKLKLTLHRMRREDGVLMRLTSRQGETSRITWEVNNMGNE